MEPVCPELLLGFSPALYHVLALLGPIRHLLGSALATLGPTLSPFNLGIKAFLNGFIPGFDGFFPYLARLRLPHPLHELDPIIPHLRLGVSPGLEQVFGLLSPFHRFHYALHSLIA